MCPCRAAIPLLLVLFTPACGGPVCGPGTVDKDGTCVPADSGETDTDTDTDTDTVVPPVGCPALPPSEGREVSIASGDVEALWVAVNSAQQGDVILLADGTYDLDGRYLWLAVDGVTVRSASGNRDAVILDGGYVTTEIVNLTASNLTLADLTVTRAVDCALHVQATNGYDTTGTLIYNVRVVDPGEHAIKLNQNEHYSDGGVVACSSLELTDTGRSHVSGCYTGGMDFHNSRGWHLYDNHIEGFWCPSGLSEHGIHLWNGNADAVIERNLIVNCARGLGLGMNTEGANTRGFEAEYDCVEGAHPDDFNGILRDNVVIADDPDLFASGYGFDAGIEVENTCGSRLLHNTVWSTEAPYSSLSWRYATTSAHVANNLVSHNLRERDVAQVTVQGNLESAQSSWFLDATGHDLHLAEGSPAIDAGVVLTGESAVPWDMDGDPRGTSPDAGADER